jgi:hypothetical protein
LTTKAILKRSAGLAIFTAGLLTFGSANMANAAGTNLIVNPGFEDPANALSIFSGMVPQEDFSGWQTTDIQHKFEVWAHTTPVNGDNQFIELNAYSAGAVYQDLTTTACDVLTFSVQHRARLVGTDVMHVLAGASGGNGADGLTVLKADTRDGSAITATTEISDDIATEGDDTAWHTWTGTYQVPAGQTSTRIAFAAVSSASGDVTAGNYIDSVSVTAAPGTCPAVTTGPTLAHTGTNFEPLAFGGFAAVIGGAALVAVTRRRKGASN